MQPTSAPCAQRTSRLPGPGRDESLGRVPAADRRAEPVAGTVGSPGRTRSGARALRRPSMPDLGGVEPMPVRALAGRQQVQDRAARRALTGDAGRSPRLGIPAALRVRPHPERLGDLPRGRHPRPSGAPKRPVHVALGVDLQSSGPATRARSSREGAPPMRRSPGASRPAASVTKWSVRNARRRRPPPTNVARPARRGQEVVLLGVEHLGLRVVGHPVHAEHQGDGDVVIGERVIDPLEGCIGHDDLPSGRRVVHGCPGPSRFIAGRLDGPAADLGLQFLGRPAATRRLQEIE